MLRPEVHATVPPAVSVTDTEPVRTDVAVVGGGASGTLTAIHLMASRAHDLNVTVHDASGEVGKGLAYGATGRGGGGGKGPPLGAPRPPPPANCPRATHERFPRHPARPGRVGPPHRAGA